MENLQEQFETAANEWYEAIIKRTGLNLKPNKRSLNGFVKGAEFGYNIATQLAAEDKKELLEAFADYIQKRIWGDDDKDFCDYVDEFLEKHETI
jgi:hypothetical protein